MPVGSLVLLALLSAEPAEDRTFKTGLATAIVLGAADIAQTAAAAERGGYREANPVMGRLFDNPTAMGLANGALTVGIVTWLAKLEAKHPKLARVFLWTWNATRAAVVVWNWRELGKK